MEAIIGLVIGAAISMVIMYFVIKAAVKDAVNAELRMINKNLTLMQEQAKQNQSAPRIDKVL
jgi:uncharacterized membrane-anchored protein YhcB (DUF1043 family)